MKTIYAVALLLVSCLLVTGLFAQLPAAAPSEEVVAPADSQPCKGCGLGADKTSGDGPFACPLFPLMYLSSGTVYYCDFYDPDCDAEVQAAYVVGEYDYPAFCPNCIAVSSRAQQGEFSGMTRPVSLNTADAPFQTGVDASREIFGESFAAADPTQGNFRAETAGLIRLSADGGDRYAVVLRVEFVRRNAGWDSRYVALEVDELPAGQEAEVTDAISPERLPGGLAYRAKFAAGGSLYMPVLILLSRSR